MKIGRCTHIITQPATFTLLSPCSKSLSRFSESVARIVGTCAAMVDERKPGQITRLPKWDNQRQSDLIHERCTHHRLCLAAYFTDTRPSINIDVYAEWNANPGFWWVLTLVNRMHCLPSKDDGSLRLYCPPDTKVVRAIRGLDSGVSSVISVTPNNSSFGHVWVACGSSVSVDAFPSPARRGCI